MGVILMIRKAPDPPCKIPIMEEKEPVNKGELENVGHLVTAMKGSVEPTDLYKVCNHLNYLDFGSHEIY